jgi:hypothetical protein
MKLLVATFAIFTILMIPAAQAYSWHHQKGHPHHDSRHHHTTGQSHGAPPAQQR